MMERLSIDPCRPQTPPRESVPWEPRPVASPIGARKHPLEPLASTGPAKPPRSVIAPHTAPTLRPRLSSGKPCPAASPIGARKRPLSGPQPTLERALKGDVSGDQVRGKGFFRLILFCFILHGRRKH
jgi:hypothetical protein